MGNMYDMTINAKNVNLAKKLCFYDLLFFSEGAPLVIPLKGMGNRFIFIAGGI